MEKQNSGKKTPINRKISRLQMSLINPIKIPLATLPTKGKIFNNNDTIIITITTIMLVEIMMIQKVIRVIPAIMKTIVMMIVIKVMIKVMFYSIKLF